MTPIIIEGTNQQAKLVPRRRRARGVGLSLSALLRAAPCSLIDRNDISDSGKDKD